MTASSWSVEEVEATVDDYIEMLRADLARVPYNKSKHRRALRAKLDDRSEGSIEFKHANISAALLDLGCPYIPGYKPRSNYQELILHVLTERLSEDQHLREIAVTDAERPGVVPELESLLTIECEPPELVLPDSGPRDRWGSRIKRVVDYVEREARNRSLGAAGERFVLQFEEERLIAEGSEPLAAKIEHTSSVRGDHEGFDVLSFNSDGSERLIEVKTTKYGRETPFFASRNEVARSEHDREKYFVYRLFNFREIPGLYRLPGAISDSCVLQAQSFVARPVSHDA
ncbi:MAG: DUF3883 domain-containing protein [Gammaproteobacteria bacterium]